MKHWIRLVMLLAVWAGSTTAAWATHVFGGQLTYKHLGGQQYRVTLTEYLDPASMATVMQTSVTLSCTRNGCSPTNTGNFTTEMMKTGERYFPSMSCTGVQNVYLARTFTVDVQLPPASWALSIDDSNRSVVMSNLYRPDQKTMHLETRLDNTTGLVDQSPQLSIFQLPFAAVGQTAFYNFGAYDADGDSLVYSLAHPSGHSSPLPACADSIAFTGYAAGQVTDSGNGQAVAFPAGMLSVGLPMPAFRAENGVVEPALQLNRQLANWW
ncbi:hypothetical protein F0P96_06220 [Hymenobacter busanensis]|uniref:Uncharacterized protein n=1 Tax=Hymenobacter busanensis TaxID=2607656 RepID=A0A7L5A0V0_9BACT|nr:hypothetical protein [Hymenobacter busanensis]KAA9338425.1 hypothetical protein F0P96_06220 [Hymenobacter busanensis]QHJ09148.1 hypothetical protein GUY19_18385 [Hymenobacter busanensis]